MKICFITHSYPPPDTAAAAYSRNFVSELIKNGFEVTVVTGGRNSSKIVEKDDDLTVYRLPMKMPIALDFMEFLAKVTASLNKIHKGEKFELIHSEHLFPSIYAGGFAKSKKLPHIVTIEGVSDVSMYSKFLFQYHKFWLPKIKADKIATWSKFLITDYFLKWGVDKGKLTVIPGAIDTKKFNPNVDNKDVKKKFDGVGDLIISAKPLYYTNAMGIVHTIKAMKVVSDEHKESKFAIVGSGRMESFLKKLVKNLGLEKYVKFVGWVSQADIPKYYKTADVVVDSFVFRHPGSITVLESLASGTPNVLSKIECLPGENNVPTGDIAVLSNAGDSDSIADGILRLLNDRKLGGKLGKNAWKMINNNFTIENVFKKYKNLYEELV